MTADAPEGDLALDQLHRRAPRPLLPRREEARLGTRHRQVLDQLEAMFLERGFSAFTISDLAAGVSCSRRTLYELAPSKEQLVLVVLDRFLHRKGRDALAALDPDGPIVEQLRRYVTGGIDFQFRAALYEDLAAEPAARRLLDRHYRFSSLVMEQLVAAGIARGEVRPLNPAVVAAAIAGSALYLSQPPVVEALHLDRERIAAELLDFLLPNLGPDPAVPPGP